MRLATFLHVSDLHFGDIDCETLDAKTSDLWAKSEWFDGLLGHSSRSMRYLEACFRKLQQSEEAQLVVTGDLTTVGKIDQFKMAADFLGSVWESPRADFLGLNYLLVS